MSRNHCILPQGFSNDVANDCTSKHKHKNSSEVRAAEAAGEIRYLDLHPANNRARYVEIAYRSSGRVSISKATIQANAGIWKNNKGEVFAADRIVKEHGTILSFDDAVVTATELKDVYYTDNEIIWYAAHSVGEHEGQPMRVVLNLRVPECRERALMFYNIAYGSEPRRRNIWTLPDRGKALSKLDESWPEIVSRWMAGPHSDPLKRTRVGKLPYELLGKVLHQYLNR